MRLNATQQAIYETLQDIVQHGQRIPSNRELGERFGMSQQAMWKNLKVLEAEGLIERDPHKARAIRLSQSASGVALLGRIAAGNPIEPLENPEQLELGDFLPESSCYALEVEGESMIEDGIRPGDYVVVRRQNHAFNGQTIVAVVDGEATLKRYYHEGSRIRLQPANHRLQPIYVDMQTPFEIRGVVQSLLRRF